MFDWKLIETYSFWLGVRVGASITGVISAIIYYVVTNW